MKQFINRIHKKLLYMLIAGLCCLPVLSGQVSADKIPDKDIVSLSIEGATLQQALQLIEKETDYRFAYDVAVISNVRKSISMKMQDKHISLILNELSAQTGLNYVVNGKTIIVTRLATNEKPANSRPGFISGKVTDETGEVLPGANIRIEGQLVGVSSDTKGDYKLTVAPGTYTVEVSFVSYKTLRITDVVVTEGKNTKLDISMVQSANELGEITVSATYKSTSINSLYARQKSIMVVSDGVSADLISRTPDKSVGEVMKRISGLSTVDNKYVVVRGLSERYNGAMLNGQVMPSTDINRKQFSFDIMPSNMVDNITVIKTITPDMSAEFGGGLVQVNTRDVPTQNFLNVTVGSSYNDNTTGKNFRSLKIENSMYVASVPETRYLFGQKSWSSLTDIRNSNFTSTPGPSGEYELLPGKRSLMVNDWGLYNNIAKPSQNYQISWGHVTDLANNRKLGITAAIGYRNTIQTSDVLLGRGGFMEAIESQFTSYDEYLNTGNSPGGLYGKEYCFTTDITGLAGIGYTTSKHKLTFQSLLMRNYDQRTTIGFGSFSSGGYGLGLLDKTTQSVMWQNQLKGSHSIGAKGIMFDWQASYITLDRQKPDNHMLLAGINKTDDFEHENFSITSAEQNPFYGSALRFWNRANEKNYNWRADVTVPFSFSLGQVLFGNSLKGGYAGWSKNRYIWVLNTQNLNTAYDFGKSFPLSEFFDTTTLVVQGGRFGDDFHRTAQLHAGYLMMDNKIGEKWNLVWGVRAEYYNLNSNNSWLEKEIGTNPNNIDYSVLYNLEPNLRFFPSASLTYSLTPQMNLRFAYSKSIIRPDLRELSNFNEYDYELGGAYQGRLVQSTILTNYDFRYECYPTSGEIISLSVFYKNIDYPMEVFYGSDGGSGYVLQNSKLAKNLGLEVEIRKSLAFTNIPVVKDLTLSGNITLLKGKVTPMQVNKLGMDYTKTPYELFIDEKLLPEQDRLQAGASNRIINAGVNYIRKLFSASISYNYMSSRLNRPELEDYQRSVYEHPLTALDAQIAIKVLKEKGEIKLNVSNLLNSYNIVYTNQTGIARDQGVYEREATVKELLYDKDVDLVNGKASPGRTFSLSLTYKF